MTSTTTRTRGMLPLTETLKRRWAQLLAGGRYPQTSSPSRGMRQTDAIGGYRWSAIGVLADLLGIPISDEYPGEIYIPEAVLPLPAQEFIHWEQADQGASFVQLASMIASVPVKTVAGWSEDWVYGNEHPAL